MADISAELQAIMDAVYGEEVRGSIHDAIQKINEVAEDIEENIDHTMRTVNEFANENVERTLLYGYNAESDTIPDIYHDNSYTLDVELSEIWDYDCLEIFGSESAFTKVKLPSTLSEVCSYLKPEDEPRIVEAYIQQTSPYNYNASDMSFLDPETMEPLEFDERYDYNIYINTNAFREYDPIYRQPYSCLIYVYKTSDDFWHEVIEWSSAFSLYTEKYHGNTTEIMPCDIQIRPKRVSGPSAEKVPYCIYLKPASRSLIYRSNEDTHAVDTIYLSEHTGTVESVGDVQGIYITKIYGVKSINQKPIIAMGEGENSFIVNDLENNVASGIYAFAEGGLTVASGDYAHAEGTGYDANGDSENDQPNVASGRASHVEGYRTEASGDYSHAEGRSTTASANYAHAEGYNNTASGYAAHVEGRQNTASQPKAHAEGTQTTASGDSSHAEGTRTTASGDSAHAEGSGTTASASGAHAEGQATHAEGDFSHAEGNSASATGSNSHAEGFGTIASGFSSHAEGDSTIALCRSQHVGGEYNTPDPDDDNNEYTKGRYIEIQGNGTSNSNRSNARTLDWEGTEWLAKSLELGPNHDELTPERVRMIDNVVETLKAVSDTRIISGPTAEFSDAQAGMPITHLEGEIIFDTEQDGSFTGKTSITLTEQHNEDTPITHTVTFPEGSSPVFGGYFDFPTGKLYITMISSSMEWGDMQFSIDPDNYLGKRIPLPNCVCGFSGEDKTFCNVTDNYIYDQSASTHFYVYRDDETTGYAVVVLPDTTPDDTVIQVVGTLAEPIVIDLDTYLLVTSAGDNSYSVDTGDILKCEYVHDVASQEYDELDARIDAIRQLPAYPDSDGSYILKLTIADGDPTLSWIPEN